ncbi:hypothetical protein NP493_17g09000 [Ridgeia piscesae]|uniref:Secreted protein n=1 Tax=Ridgeia piscesae TaxID=27915 RepID=A0AAD9PE17_RIDPI|nr:hypothetical protein NP493_17g09000 [Ridgeia piscesae]
MFALFAPAMRGGACIVVVVRASGTTLISSVSNVCHCPHTVTFQYKKAGMLVSTQNVHVCVVKCLCHMFANTQLSLLKYNI